MDLSLTRTSFNEWGILGTLTDKDGLLKLYSLEHAYLIGNSYLPKVPEGVYQCVLGTHQLAHGGPFQTYEVTGVPGHSNILLHVGNQNQDSEGCILLGESLGNQGILNSRAAFQAFMGLQAMCPQFTLTVTS